MFWGLGASKPRRFNRSLVRLLRAARLSPSGFRLSSIWRAGSRTRGGNFKDTVHFRLCSLLSWHRCRLDAYRRGKNTFWRIRSHSCIFKNIFLLSVIHCVKHLFIRFLAHIEEIIRRATSEVFLHLASSYWLRKNYSINKWNHLKSNDLKLVLLLIFGLFAFCDFIVNLIQVECLNDILFCKVELLKLAACLDNRALLQSSAVLHQNNCGKLLGHRISSYFEFLCNIVVSANIDLKFVRWARIKRETVLFPNLNPSHEYWRLSSEKTGATFWHWGDHVE